jgi:predicted ATPase/DNA-binding SARP family transcriptional activator
VIMSSLTLHLLGPPRFQLDDSLISIPRRKVAALLVYLAVTAKAHSREVLIDLLFPKQSRARARADFRNTLSVLRHRIGERWLEIDGTTIRLATGEDLWVDVHEFRSLTAGKGASSATGASAETISRLIAAVDLYGGDFLAGFYLKDSPGFDQWQFLELENLRIEYYSALEQLVKTLEEREDFKAALEYGRKWLALDPIEETVHRELIRLYAAAGHRTLALRQYEKCKEVLKQELGDQPEEQTEVLVENIRSKRYVQQERSRREDRSTNLPVDPFPLIGRKSELAQIIDILAGKNIQILTLTGSAGAGKTRLAVEAAAGLTERFEHGVFFVDLTKAREHAEVIPTIARALEVRESVGHGSSMAEILKGTLRNRSLLLLLDNFEHVRRAAYQIADLVRACSGLKVLVTSREHLHIKDEQEIEISPLGVPGSEDDRSAESCMEAEATRLFVRRATAVNPRFSLTDANAGFVAQICRHLDGLPLAIELATSRLNVFTPLELLQKLADRLELLSERSITRPLRHRTLIDAIEWSYDLLEEKEKTLFSSLSIFSGGSSFQAIEQVCAPPGFNDELDVVDTLASLVDKSLVRQEIVDGKSRFTMLETIGEYARIRLEASAQAGQVRMRHAEHYLSLALEAEGQVHGPDQLSWLDTLELEINNLHTALSWLLQTRKVKKALQLAISLKWFWYRYGHFSQGRRWLEQTLAAADAKKYTVLRAKALHALGWMHFIQGKWRGASDLYHRSLQLFRAEDDRAGEGMVLADLGVVERWLCDRSTGDRDCEQAVEIAREVGDPLQVSIALIWAYATTGGQFEDTSPQRKLEEAVNLSRKLGNMWGVSHGLNGLGDLLRETGRYKEAYPRYEEALKGFRKLRDRWMTAWTLEGLGTTMSRLGDFSGAEEYLRESLKLFHSLEDQSNTVYMLNRMGMMKRNAGCHRQAARLLGSYRGLLEVFVGNPCAKRHSQELDTAFRQYQHTYPEEWSTGQVMSLEQAVEYALGCGCD